MKSNKALFVMALVAMLSFSCSNDLITEDEVNTLELNAAPAAKDIEIEILERVNAYRLEIGLEALNNHDTVKAVAHSHTDYMVEVNHVSHDNFFLRKNSLVKNAAATVVSENVAYAYSSAESVVNAWLRSDGHRENIEGDYTDFDVSAEQDADGKWYFTNIFMKR